MKKMRWTILLVMIMMGSIVGCSEKKEVERASTESKNNNEKNEASKLVGNWQNDDWYFTLKKQNENLVMSLEDDGKYWDLTLEVQNVKKDRVEAIVVNSSSQSQERSIGSKVIFKLKGDGDLEEIIESPSGVQQAMAFTKTVESRSTWAEKKKKREATREEFSGKLQALVEKKWINEEVFQVWYAGDEITFTYFGDDSSGLNIKIDTISDSEYKGKVVNATKKPEWKGKQAVVKTTSSGVLEVYVGNAKKLTLKSSDIEEIKYKKELSGKWKGEQNTQSFSITVFSGNEINISPDEEKTLKIGIFEIEGNVLKGKVANAPGSDYKEEWLGKPIEIHVKNEKELELIVNKKEKLVLTK